MAEQFLEPSERKPLLEKFEEIDMERVGEGNHQEYINLVKESEKKLKLI